MSDLALSTEGLAKAYRIGLADDEHDNLTQALLAGIRAPIRNLQRLRRMTDLQRDLDRGDVVWALRDLDLEVRTGDVVGVIGRNGAGKSTLLKILSRITKPTRGRATIHGRVGSLLEVGTGFHPDLTGRENVYLNGTILGMSKAEIDRKFDEIVAFAEVERFIDTPVKRYSSGMGVRLAFSVAAHLEPEILLIDEVLAVGDVPFQKKCLGRIGEVAGEGRTVLFVSHNIGAVEALCTRTIVLEQGKLVADGTTSEGIERYLRFARGETTIDLASSPRSSRLKPVLRRLRLSDASGRSTNTVPVDDDLLIEIELDLGDQSLPAGAVHIDVTTHLGQVATVLRSDREEALPLAGRMKLKCRLRGIRLAVGEYSISVTLYDPHRLMDQVRDATTIEVRPTARHRHRPQLTGLWIAETEWSAEAASDVAAATAEGCSNPDA